MQAALSPTCENSSSAYILYSLGVAVDKLQLSPIQGPGEQSRESRSQEDDGEVKLLLGSCSTPACKTPLNLAGKNRQGLHTASVCTATASSRAEVSCGGSEATFVSTRGSGWRTELTHQPQLCLHASVSFCLSFTAAKATFLPLWPQLLNCPVIDKWSFVGRLSSRARVLSV